MLTRAVIAMLCLSAPAFAECWYTYTEVPNPPGWYCQGWAINARGEVAGYALSDGDNARAFVWSPMNGTRLLPYPPGFDDMRAYDINDHGHVVGYAVTPTGTWRGFIWRDEQYEFIEPAPWANATEAYAINNANQVAGVTRLAAWTPIHASRWDNGVLFDIAALTGTTESYANAVNDDGGVSGHAYFGNVRRAFYADGNSLEWLAEPSAIVASVANASNRDGIVVGVGFPVLTGQAFRKIGIVWTPGGAHTVEAPAGTRDAVLRSVNDFGCVVGSYEFGTNTPILWRAGNVIDLRAVVFPAAPVGLSYAFDINRRGQIVAWAAAGTVVLNPIRMTGDVTGDCLITLEDLLRVLSNFGCVDSNCVEGDVDEDGDIDLADLTTLLANWGR